MPRRRGNRRDRPRDRASAREPWIRTVAKAATLAALQAAVSHGAQTKTPPCRRGSCVGSALQLFGSSGSLLRPVHQFDVSHRCVVAVAIAALEDPQIAAGTRAVARPEFHEQLADRLLVAQARKREAAVC